MRFPLRHAVRGCALPVLSAVLLLFSCQPASSQGRRLLNTLQGLARATVAEGHAPLKTPYSVDHGAKVWLLEPVTGWRSGFWPGIEWYLFEATGDAYWREQAAGTTRMLETILSKPPHSHDIGFQFMCSYGNGLRLTGDASYKAVMLRAADSLAKLFDPRYGSICSWPYRLKTGWPHHVIIDNMMNLELLFWAARNGGGERLRDIAVAHARTTIRSHFREDGSTAHVAWFNPGTGQPEKKITHQGHADGSMWARGQAWAIYGYTVCARETGDAEFLQTAVRAADVYLRRLPADMIPYWDFDDPGIPKVERDASAAAITASALLELAGLVKDAGTAERYRTAARRMLDELSSPRYLKPEANHSFLQHSTGNKPQGKDIDVPLIYADYYYLEALLRSGRLKQAVRP